MNRGGFSLQWILSYSLVSSEYSLIGIFKKFQKIWTWDFNYDYSSTWCKHDYPQVNWFNPYGSLGKLSFDLQHRVLKQIIQARLKIDM